MFFNLKNPTAILLPVGFFVLDLFLKQLALRGFFLEIISGLFSFHLSLNSGIAFSWPVPRLLVIILSVLMLMFLIVLTWRSRFYWISFLGFNLIIFGAFSNLLDRLWNSAVIDYFDLAFFSIFNLADGMIVAGCLILLSLKSNSCLWYNKTNESQKNNKNEV